MSQTIYLHSWSGGKDSTASVILDHINNLPPSKIVFSEVMFDLKRNISGENPEHIDFVRNKAIPQFEKWGYKVDVVRADRDYLDCFYHIVTRSKKIERNGKYRGFLIGGMCVANKELKIAPIQKYIRQTKVQGNLVQYVGIAVDEPKRLERLDGVNKISLLARYGYTEQMAYDLCKDYDLLSPTYEYSRRGGCWFCPNENYLAFARIKTAHPKLWEELRELSKCENLASYGFKYGETFSQVDLKVDDEIRTLEVEKNQLSLF